jgi:hypothetical protein
MSAFVCGKFAFKSISQIRSAALPSHIGGMEHFRLFVITQMSCKAPEPKPYVNKTEDLDRLNIARSLQMFVLYAFDFAYPQGIVI